MDCFCGCTQAGGSSSRPAHPSLPAPPPPQVITIRSDDPLAAELDDVEDLQRWACYSCAHSLVYWLHLFQACAMAASVHALLHNSGCGPLEQTAARLGASCTDDCSCNDCSTRRELRVTRAFPPLPLPLPG